MNDPRPTFSAAVRTASKVVDGVGSDQRHLPTPCEDYDVEDLLFHLVGVVDRVAVVGRGGNPFEVERRPSLDGAWAEAVATTEQVWADDVALEVPSPLPWAPGKGIDVLKTYIAELTVHTWDLAAATGQTPAWDPDALQVSLEWAENLGTTPEARAERFAPIYAQLPPEFAEMPPPFADPLPVADDAPVLDKIVAWSGRLPSWG